MDSASVGYIYGMPCPRRCEAMESVVVRALYYIDMTVITQSETYTTGSGDRLGLQPVCRIHVLVRFIRTVTFNHVYSNNYIL